MGCRVCLGQSSLFSSFFEVSLTPRAACHHQCFQSLLIKLHHFPETNSGWLRVQQIYACEETAIAKRANQRVNAELFLFLLQLPLSPVTYLLIKYLRMGHGVLFFRKELGITDSRGKTLDANCRLAALTGDLAKDVGWGSGEAVQTFESGFPALRGKQQGAEQMCPPSEDFLSPHLKDMFLLSLGGAEVGGQ